MKSVWRGHIRFSLVTIPIQVFNAIETSNTISFNQLHKEDMGRVGYRKVCKVCDQELQSKDIVKGFEYEKDQYVVIENDELDQVKIKSSKAIDMEAFIDINEVHPSRYETPYFVGPNGDVASKTFNLFVQSLEKTGKAGVGKIVLRDKEDVVLLKPFHNGLIMYKLRYPYEVRDINDLPDLSTDTVEESQLNLAETLINSLTKTFDKIEFKDHYHDAVLDLINAKIDGNEIVTSADDNEETPVIDIMEALKASIEEAKAKKAAG